MSRSKQKVIDSHVHLWPVETANEDGHKWMPPGMPIAKAQLPPDYLAATRSDEIGGSNVEVQGLVFIETDVRYDTPGGDVSIWAKAPLEEITFVRTIVEGGFGYEASQLMIGIVPWAPMDQETSVLEQYLHLSRLEAGEATWKRVKGFRFLLQAIVDQGRFKALVLSKTFIDNLRLLGNMGLSFDVGVDQRSCGIWQLELMAQAMSLAHNGVEDSGKVTFIINHLCKPDFANTGAGLEQWCKAISSISRLSRTYMKLSGAFSELPSDLGVSKPLEIAGHLKPWLAHLFKSFGPTRVMFGSDWPVCNLKQGGEDSWVVWKDVVEVILDDNDFNLNNNDRRWLWYKTAEEAYRLT